MKTLTAAFLVLSGATLRTDDRAVSSDGAPILSPEQALEAYTRLRQLPAPESEVLRRGRRITLPRP